MALDEALLLSARLDLLTLRIYGWSPPTLSLGYFQQRTDVPSGLSRSYPIVRRPTGGGAILHQSEEITISLTGRSRHPPGPARAAGWMLEGVCRALNPLGIHPRFAGEGKTVRAGGGGPFFCSALRQPLDVVVDLQEGPRKLLGTAQRRRGGAWLIHGGFLLGRPRGGDPDSGLASEISIQELLGGKVQLETEGGGLHEQILKGLARGFGAVFERSIEEGPPGPGESRLALQLLAERYSTATWMERR
jgi:lipoate-protein ligase A